MAELKHRKRHCDPSSQLHPSPFAEHLLLLLRWTRSLPQYFDSKNCQHKYLLRVKKAFQRARSFSKKQKSRKVPGPPKELPATEKKAWHLLETFSIRLLFGTRLHNVVSLQGGGGFAKPALLLLLPLLGGDLPLLAEVGVVHHQHVRTHLACFSLLELFERGLSRWSWSERLSSISSLCSW